jgi:hypothetical protein
VQKPAVLLSLPSFRTPVYDKTCETVPSKTNLSTEISVALGFLLWGLLGFEILGFGISPIALLRSQKHPTGVVGAEERAETGILLLQDRSVHRNRFVVGRISYGPAEKAGAGNEMQR